MNNAQFRRLLADTPGTARKGDGGSTGRSGDQKQAGTPTALGSRMRSNIPMTPRSVSNGAGIDFARQLAERNAALDPKSTKKFRSSAAPKGTKLGLGYQDRTQLRTSAEEDEKASRVKALEEMVKLGQMERATFEALRDEIVGGDVKDVHLVKGLDYKLLERVRRGEDVLAEAAASPKPATATAEDPPIDKPADVDEEFAKLEERDIQPVAKKETVKRGEMAPPPLPPSTAGKKRTRDDILKELKASRQAAAERAEQARQSALGSKFRKIGEKKATSRIEIDARGREVLITVDADGNVKRKVKKVKPETTNQQSNGLLMPDKDAKPLGLDVQVPVMQPFSPEAQDDGDIFEGAGADYDPLAAEEFANDDSSTDSENDEDRPPTRTKTKSPPPTEAAAAAAAEPTANKLERAPIPLPRNPSTNKNYFNEPTPPPQSEAPLPPPTTADSQKPFQDPIILAALRKGSTLTPLLPTTVTSSSSEHPRLEADNDNDKLERRRKLIEAQDRDAEDLDMGFGSSRFEDEEDGEGEGGKRVRLSVWGGSGGDGGDKEGGGMEGKGEGKAKRKRGPKKKKKGDKDSAADVLSVLARRKGDGE
ncbi:MAG: hypothetical protein Q9219_003000 [cf. Caloplaca sp. 3 TL-2023]